MKTTSHGEAAHCLGPRAVLAPRNSTPAGAWDTHAHVLGGDARFPFTAARSYTPPSASPDNYLAMLDGLGIQYGLLVQPSVHGADNSLVLHALRQAPDRLRAVVAIDGDEPQDTLCAWKDSGVVGVRVNELFSGGTTAENLEELAALCRGLGWHIELALHAPRIAALLPQLLRLDVRWVIDHIGWIDVSRGLDSEEFAAMRELLLHTDCWMKLSALYRLSREGFPYGDVRPFARAFLDIAPHRMLWGSDWPHCAIYDHKLMPHTESLLDVLAAHAGADLKPGRLLTQHG